MRSLGVGGKAVSRGQVLLVRSSTTSSSRRQCDGGGRSGLFSDSDSFYQLCQLSALSASILRLPEQTKTGATSLCLRLPEQTETVATEAGQVSCWPRPI